MYTRTRFGKELKEKTAKREPIAEIGEWSHDIYQGDVDTKDVDFLNLLISLGTMELGPEFALSYETLNKIADDLIAGKCKDNTWFT